MTARGEPAKFIEAALQFTSTECLDWPFAKSREGYGRLRYPTRMVYANRLVCELAHGEPPSKRHQAAHNCGNTRCVNPRHLAWKTAQENSNDKFAHGTVLRGEDCHQAKLTELQVGEIRALRGQHAAHLIAAMYGVTRQTINRIHSGQIWSTR